MNNIPVVFVVQNNSGYMSIRGGQRKLMDRHVGTEFNSWTARLIAQTIRRSDRPSASSRTEWSERRISRIFFRKRFLPMRRCSSKYRPIVTRRDRGSRAGGTSRSRRISRTSAKRSTPRPGARSSIFNRCPPNSSPGNSAPWQISRVPRHRRSSAISP